MNTQTNFNSSDIRNSLEIYKNIIGNAHDIILLIDSSGNIVDANGQAVKSYGYTYDELTSIDIFRLRNSANVELARKQFEQAKFNGIEFETVHFRKDKSSFPVEVKSIGLEHGSKYYIASIVRDITNRKRKEEEIRTLASIVESSHDAILSTFCDGTIASWNKGAEDLFLYTKQDVIGKHASILVPENNTDNINNIIDKVRRHERIEHYETLRRRKDGKLLNVSVMVSPIYDFEKNFVGVSAIMRDLTEKYTLEKKLNEHEERWKLANELILGNSFQTSLMPTYKSFRGIQMFGKYVPSSMVGGDLYDCTAVGDSIWFIIADVAGHGLVAAMLSTMIKGVFNNCIQNWQYPHEVLENMNSILCETQMDLDTYLVSAFIGVIKEGTLYFSNAGHPYPVLINSTGDAITPLEQNGFLLAMQKESKYESIQVNISTNDTVLLYTDGIFNLKNKTGITFWDKVGKHSLINAGMLNADPQTYIKKLIASFEKDFEEGFEDDVSIMMIRIN